MPILNKQTVITPYLPLNITHKKKVTAFAPSNIALCKYWGKRNDELNLPNNGSLSISLANLGTTTVLALSTDGKDRVWLNGQLLDNQQQFVQKVIAFINLFRGNNNIPVHVHTTNSIATSAGLASSASGFGALMMAVNDFFNLELSLKLQSVFARMGSGSACRSFYHGFVEWHKGEKTNGMDSYATPISLSDASMWHRLRIGLVKVDLASKKIDSRTAMKRTVETSYLYRQWANQAEKDLAKIKYAIDNNNFTQLGETAEHNALSMHATMISTFPPVLYWQPESVSVMHKVWELREQGVEVYLTMDAGANVKLLFLADQQTIIEQAFDNIEVINPFGVNVIGSI